MGLRIVSVAFMRLCTQQAWNGRTSGDQNEGPKLESRTRGKVKISQLKGTQLKVEVNLNKTT